MSPKSAFFIVYDRAQLDAARAAHIQGDRIVAIDFWLEQELARAGIPFASITDILKSNADVGDWWLKSHALAKGWYRLPELSFFHYRGIRFGEVVEPIFGEYLARLFFYARIFLALRSAHPDAVFSLPAPKPNLNDPTCLASLIPWVPLDAALLSGISLREHVDRVFPETFSFPRRTWKQAALDSYNKCISLLPRAPFTLYASEYWNYLACAMPYLRDFDVLLWESVRWYQIPLRDMLRHRIRVRQTQGPVSAMQEDVARRATAHFEAAWRRARQATLAFFTQEEGRFEWTPVLGAIDQLMLYAPRIVADIDALAEVVEHDRPDVVLTMASTGGPQHYFYLMAHVARLYGVPSLELQHAGVHLDPRSVYTRIETDYLATYGVAVGKHRARAGLGEAQRLVPLGAPRFDPCVTDYARLSKKGKQILVEAGLDMTRPVLFAAVLFSDTAVSSIDIDSYELAAYFQVIRDIQRQTPGLQVIFKFRHTKYIGHIASYLQTLFDEGAMAYVGDVDVFALLTACDVVVTGNSTLIYQTLLAKKPLVLYPWKKVDVMRGAMYEEAAPRFEDRASAIEAVTRILAEPSYRKTLLERQRVFLQGYRFDGHASERLAQLIRDLAEAQPPKR